RRLRPQDRPRHQALADHVVEALLVALAGDRPPAPDEPVLRAHRLELARAHADEVLVRVGELVQEDGARELRRAVAVLARGVRVPVDALELAGGRGLRPVQTRLLDEADANRVELLQEGLAALTRERDVEQAAVYALLEPGRRAPLEGDRRPPARGQEHRRE